MDIERPPETPHPGLRVRGLPRRPVAQGSAAPPPPINALAELVADLLAATGLVPADKLALVRAPRAWARSHMPSWSRTSPRARAWPARSQRAIRCRSSTCSDRRGDEAANRVRSTCSSAWWRSRTRSTTERCGSPSPIRATSRASTSCGSRPAIRSRSASPHATTSSSRSAALPAPPRRSAPGPRSRRSSPKKKRADDLEVEDGISDAPLVRLVNSVIFQAAEDGASDVHFEPQEDCLLVRFRVDGVLHEVQRIPKRMMPGVLDPHEGAREARHRRAPQTAGRPHLAERCRSRPNARRSCCDPADGRRRVRRHASARQVEEAADAPGARHVATRCAQRSRY